MNAAAKDANVTALEPRLRESVQAAVQAHFNTARTILQFKHERSRYSSSFSIEELELVMDDGSVLSLVFKDMSENALLPEAQETKPDFMVDPRREIAVYLSVLPLRALETAACIGSMIDEQNRQYWLFLEKVPAKELWQFGEFDIWLDVARWLARFHESFAPSLEEFRSSAPLLNYDRCFYELWPNRARTFPQFQTGPLRKSMDRLTRQYSRAIDRLIDLPRTLLHGDFNASNVLVQKSRERMRICPVDWEMAAVGPGYVDLAALISGRWTDAQKMALVNAYLDQLRSDRPESDGHAQALVDLKHCQLHLAIQWLAWSPNWSPPREHEQDWLAQAIELAEQLGL